MKHQAFYSAAAVLVAGLTTGSSAFAVTVPGGVDFGDLGRMDYLLREITISVDAMSAVAPADIWLGTISKPRLARTEAATTKRSQR
jgi:hypothetical protein